ncbi:MAG: hypothetical protein KF681_15380 [Bdellovibrionaceae bacterium]|nr:hypothetical protein [Pseudobdellovibrionaceae bacterium]
MGFQAPQTAFWISRLASATALALSLAACGPAGTLIQNNSGGGASIRPEGTEKPYSSPVSVTGSYLRLQVQANFVRFNDDSNGGTRTGTGSSGNPYKQGLVTTETRPIRRAEAVVINNANENVVQAGHTDNLGQTDLQIPNVPGTYRIEIRSRADNTYLKASILDNPYDKNYYRLYRNFTITSGVPSGTIVGVLGGAIVAPHNGASEGGAFNILDNILIANDYLRTHVQVNDNAGTADYCPSSICNVNFTVAPKVQVYWTKGLSPAAYYGSPSSAISFFASSSGGGIYTGLYILGGIEGSVCADTDHFDNSVILHEYGHFLEHVYATSDSPGGSHNGNKIIDPRLAWSEGWANFFQAVALGRPFYRDTQRNAECPALYSSGTASYYTARLSFTDFDMEVQQGTQDAPSLTGEGNFREISVSRVLWDSITGGTQSAPYGSAGNTDGTAADLGFAVIWNAFTSLTSSSISARSVGHLHSSLFTMLTTMGSSYLNAWRDDSYADSSKPLVREKQHRDVRDFALPLTPQSVAHGSCVANPNLANYTQPDWIFTSTGPKRDTTNSQGYIDWSDLFNTNDVYRYYYDGSANRRYVRLFYKKLVGDSSGITNPWDLDVYVYNEGFVFMNSSDIVKKSERDYPEAVISGHALPATYTGSEVIDFSGLSPGFYYLNVKAYFVGSTAPVRAGAQYYLENGNGDQLCP